MSQGVSPGNILPPSGARILIVIPTLGERVAYLRQTLESVSSQSVPADVLVVVPTGAREARSVALEMGAHLMDDPGGQSAAINLGIAQAHGRHEYVNWLGDDDTLTEGSLAAVSAALDRSPTASAAFGQCQYVDQNDRPVWVSKAGRSATWVLPWGPNLVPQPGALMRRRAWQELGGLDSSLRYTMDMDLFLRLRRWGPLVPVPALVSTFRWHAESLTVSERAASLAEGEAVKRRYLPTPMIPLAPVWEAPVRVATKYAAAQVTKRSLGA